MSRRTSVRLAVSMLALVALSLTVTLLVAVVNGRPSDAASTLLPLAWVVVGGLVALREPGNSVGWLLLVAALASGLQGVAEASFRGGSHSDLAVAAAWYDGWAWYVWFFCAGLFLPLLFPDGRLPSPRWRVLLLMELVALALCIIGQAFAPARRGLDVTASQPIDNPLGTRGIIAHVVDVAATVGSALALVGLLLSALSFVVRLRRSSGRERQQLKVLAFVILAAAAAFLVIVAGAVLGELFGVGWAGSASEFAWLPALLLVILGVPIAVAVAILRHRLYNVDLVINRAVVYVVLTATLATTYVGLVLALQQLLSPRTGTSDLAVAGSTLAVAALFRPARRGIQGLVDRRFFRRRYDAAHTLDAFTGRLRHEIDLESVGDDLCATVRDTVAPTTLSLWLRP